MAYSSTMSLILLSKNHAEFVEECIDSIYKELGSNVPIVNLDFESTDETAAKIESLASSYSMSLVSKSISPKTGTLSAILEAPIHKEVEHVILLSADDTFLPNYGSTLGTLALRELSPKVVNFGLLIGEDVESASKIKVPKWSQHSFINSLMLSVGNPGTAPGSVLPWQVLNEIRPSDFIKGNLIEDYPMWWFLQGKAEFLNIEKPLVFYRRHGGNLTKSRGNPDYAFSLGFNAGLPLKQKSLVLKLIGVLLFPKWIRHISVLSMRPYVKGFLFCLRHSP